MQAIRATQALNKAELENATPSNASWHRDYKDTAYIYIGGLPLDLSEGDVVTIFSQYGHPTHLNLIRDKETGKSKGFAFLKYEDQRSCDLAVDNLGGAKVFDRMLRVDHTRYKKRDDEDEETYRIDKHDEEILNQNGKRGSDSDQPDSGKDQKRRKRSRKMLKSERELEEMLAIKENGEEEDPMRQYLIREKQDEVAKEREREDRKERRHKHRHRHRDEGDADKDRSDRPRSNRRDKDDYRDSGGKHRRREDYDDAGHPGNNRDHRRRHHSDSDDGERPRHKRGGTSRDRSVNQHDSSRRRRDTSREPSSDYTVHERRRREDDEGNRDKRRSSRKDERRTHPRENS